MRFNVRFGSKADIAASPTNVRFTPKSGHWLSLSQCPLWLSAQSVDAQVLKSRSTWVSKPKSRPTVH
jgi:hypothetical protein